MPTITKKTGANVAVSVLAILITFVLLEAGGRLWLNYVASTSDYRSYVLYEDVEPSMFRWAPHHYLNYYPSPHYNQEGTYHNSLGYRNDEFPLKPPAGVFRIAVLGGSTVYTEKVKDNAKTFTAQLENTLQEQYGYTNVQVINAGVPGYTSWETLINLEFRVLDLEPDMIIIYHNTNDVHARLVTPETYRGDNSGARVQWHHPPIKWWEYSTILRIASRKLDLTEQVRLDDFVGAPTTVDRTGADPYAALQQNPPVYFERNLRNMIAIARENEVAVMLSTWAYSPHFGDYASRDYFQQAYQQQNDIIRMLSDTHNVPMFDFAVIMPQAEEYWADGRHVNEKGARLKAELFAEFIDKAGLIAK